MSVRHRLQAVEERLNVHDGTPVIVFWDGRDDERLRERVEYARERGVPLRIIRFGVTPLADTVEEAEALVAEHQAKGRVGAITVYKRDSYGVDVLAKWDPGLPEWLRDEDP